MKRTGWLGKSRVALSAGAVRFGAAPQSLLNDRVAYGPRLDELSIPATRQKRVPSGRSAGGVAFVLTVSTEYSVVTNPIDVETWTRYLVAPLRALQLSTGFAETVAPSAGAVSVGGLAGATANAVAGSSPASMIMDSTRNAARAPVVARAAMATVGPPRGRGDDAPPIDGDANECAGPVGSDRTGRVYASVVDL